MPAFQIDRDHGLLDRRGEEPLVPVQRAEITNGPPPHQRDERPKNFLLEHEDKSLHGNILL
jgi:hypothetical protein